MDTKSINCFIEEVNSELGDVIMIERRQDRAYPSFELKLRPTKFVMRDQVVIDWGDEFEDLIIRCGVKHFGDSPYFNNTHRIFSFIK